MFRARSAAFQCLALVAFLVTVLASRDQARSVSSVDPARPGAEAPAPWLQVSSFLLREAHARDPGVVTPKVGDKGESQAKPEADQKKPEEKKEIGFFSMIMSALAGVVLFIFGVTQLAQGLTDINTDRMRKWVARFTTNRFAGVATGVVATTLLESSSVTIIMVIAMVSSGVMNAVHSLGVVLGANIGTTVGAQIIALDIEQYVPILMVSGLLLIFVGRSNTQKKLGVVVLGFGLMFYGLEAIDEAVKPLRTHEPFLAMMKSLGDNPLLGALVGAVFTIVIQSSSATVAIIITLAGSGLISLPTGVAIMLGAEIGTCADTLVATIGRGRAALRTGVFHLSFNLSTAVLGVAFAPLLVRFVETISGGASVGHKIANAQIIFNVLGVASVIAFLPAIARGLERLIPDSPKDAQKAKPSMPDAQPASM